MNNTDPFLSPEDIDVLKRTQLDGYTEAEQESFIRLAQRTQLDPFSKQLYATRRWVKNRQGEKTPTLVPVTSVLGLTAVAARTGHYDGCIITWCGPDGVWKDEWVSEEFPVAAKCIVFHKQRSHPEIAICRWNGYAGTSFNPSTKRREVTEFWERLPDFMLGKCAKAAALRGAFPDQCGNLYASEELQGNISEADQYDDEAKVTANRAKEEELFKAAAASKNVKIVESKPVKRPTPAEAAEPAFPEPPKPMAAAPVATAPSPASVENRDAPDDLDMGEEPAAPQSDASAEAPAEPGWADHVIAGLRNPKFLGRKVGDLNPVELAAIGEQWIPKVRAVWDTVKVSQKEDALAIEAAIAHSKADKPW